MRQQCAIQHSTTSCQQLTVGTSLLQFFMLNVIIFRLGGPHGNLKRISLTAFSEIVDGNISYLDTTSLPACDIISRLGAGHDSYNVFHWWCSRQIFGTRVLRSTP